MSEPFVRVRVRCKSCRQAALLSPDHYRSLVKGTRLELYCPRCAQPLAFDPLKSGATKRATARPAPVAVEEKVEPPAPVPVQTPAATSPAFPPPPFAPLAAGSANASPADVAMPAFAPLGTGPSAPLPAGPEAPGRARKSASAKPKLTLNERWKRLPQWAQWLVIGVVVLVLAVVIFAMPSGGSNDGASQQPTTEERKP